MYHFLPHLIEQHQIWNRSVWHVWSCNLGVESFWIVSRHKQFFWLLELFVCTTKSFKDLNPTDTWIQVSGISIPNFLIIKKTLLEWLTLELRKVLFLTVSTKKDSFDAKKWWQFFFTSQGLKRFLLQTGTIVPNLVQIKKGTLKFEKKNYWRVSRKHTFSNCFILFINAITQKKL